VAPEIVQVHIVLPAPHSTTWWDRLTQFLGARLSINRRPEVGTTFTVESTAYAPAIAQTDATPCLTAAGTHVRPGVVASNFLPLGTLLKINDQEFIVEDRMNARYEGPYIDVWFPSTTDARTFGRKKLDITISGYSEPGAPIRGGEKMTSAEKEKQSPGVWQRFLSGLTSFLGARTGVDSNSNDVACF